jgi:hypothetical protein
VAPWDGKKNVKINVSSPDAVQYAKYGMGLLGTFENLCTMRGQVVGTDTIAIPGGPTFTLQVNPAYNVLTISQPRPSISVPVPTEEKAIVTMTEEKSLKLALYFKTNFSDYISSYWDTPVRLLKGEVEEIVEASVPKIEITIAGELATSSQTVLYEYDHCDTTQFAQTTVGPETYGAWELFRTYTSGGTVYVWRRDCIVVETFDYTETSPYGVFATGTMTRTTTRRDETKTVNDPTPPTTGSPASDVVGGKIVETEIDTPFVLTGVRVDAKASFASESQHLYFLRTNTRTDTMAMGWATHNEPGYPYPGQRTITEETTYSLVTSGVAHELSTVVLTETRTSLYWGMYAVWTQVTRQRTGDYIEPIDLHLYKYDDPVDGDTPIYLASWYSSTSSAVSREKMTFLVQKGDICGKPLEFSTFSWHEEAVADLGTAPYSGGWEPEIKTCYCRGEFIAVEAEEKRTRKENVEIVRA